MSSLAPCADRDRAARMAEISTAGATAQRATDLRYSSRTCINLLLESSRLPPLREGIVLLQTDCRLCGRAIFPSRFSLVPVYDPHSVQMHGYSCSSCRIWLTSGADAVGSAVGLKSMDLSASEGSRQWATPSTADSSQRRWTVASSPEPCHGGFNPIGDPPIVLRSCPTQPTRPASRMDFRSSLPKLSWPLGGSRAQQERTA